MEYKIGQRVRYKENGKEYYFNERKADGCYDLIDKNGNWAATIFPGATHLIETLYKPGDKVRVKSKRKLLSNGWPNKGADLYAEKIEKIERIDGNIVLCESGGWYEFKDFEWYSGVEDKLADAEQFFDSLEEHEMHGFSTPEEYIKWLKDDTILVAEVHQDKERNRAALAEVLKIQEPTTNKWMCPKCRFAGSIPDVRQHCVVAHGESLPPPESKSYWETWRVS